MICLDKKRYESEVLMGLLTTFDTNNHELLIAAPNAYGFSKDALKIIFSFLSNRFKRAKINTTFSSWTKLTQGLPQRSILGIILFKMYLNDSFFHL